MEHRAATPDSGHPGRYKENFLPKLAGGDTKTTGVYASQSNRVGQVVGWVTNSIIGQLGGFWNNDAAHSVVDLGTLPGDTESTASGINSAGQVIGTSAAGTFPMLTGRRAFLYQNGMMQELAMLIDPADGSWTIDYVAGINNAGQIIATGTTGGRSAMILLTPIQ